MSQLHNIRTLIKQNNFKGDEIDQTNSQLAETRLLTQQNRLKRRLIEIDVALHKMHSGKYGVCELTEEPISAARLLAIPWTRLSIEGAEVSDRLRKRFKQTGHK